MKTKKFPGKILPILIMGLACNATMASTEWAQYQGNASHTGYSDVALTGSYSLAWTKTFSGNINPVTAAAGEVFVSTQGYFNGQNLFALDATNGSVLWGKDFGSVFSVNPPSYADGTVFVQTGNHSSDTYLRGYDAQTGALLTKVSHAAQWERYYAPTLYGGQVYANGGYYGGAYSFNPKTSDQNWFTPLPQYDNWTPAVNDKYVVAFTDHLTVMDRTTGSVQKQIFNPGQSWNGWSADGSPVLSGDHAYVVTSNQLVNFNLVTGVIDWTVNGVGGHVAIDGNDIFAIRNGALASIDATTGSTRWMWEDPANSALAFEVIATQDDILVSSSTATYAVDRDTHTTNWSTNVGGRLALGNDQLYIASGQSLYAYNVSAVPEPGEGAMLLAGLGLVALVARRKKAGASRASHA
jgi:outer membrane protein assembly factor BamB